MIFGQKRRREGLKSKNCGIGLPLARSAEKSCYRRARGLVALAVNTRTGS
jgi:hypothetical protein